MKWFVELSECDIHFRPRTFIKGQAFADFVTKFTHFPEVKIAMEPMKPPT